MGVKYAAHGLEPVHAWLISNPWAANFLVHYLLPRRAHFYLSLSVVLRERDKAKPPFLQWLRSPPSSSFIFLLQLTKIGRKEEGNGGGKEQIRKRGKEGGMEMKLQKHQDISFIVFLGNKMRKPEAIYLGPASRKRLLYQKPYENHQRAGGIALSGLQTPQETLHVFIVSLFGNLGNVDTPMVSSHPLQMKEEEE